MRLVLVRKRTEGSNVTSFIFTPFKSTEQIIWEAGQYGHYVLHHEPTDDRGSDRWFTVSAAPFEKHLMITTRFTRPKGSSFKKALKKLKIGEKIEISDLHGHFVVEDLKKEYVFIAAGIGITPFRSMLKELDHTGKRIHVTLIYGNRDKNITFKNELEDIAKRNPKLKIFYIISPDHIDEKTIRLLVPDLATPLFYVSGPEPVVISLANTLKRMGIEDERIKRDEFPGYVKI